MEKLEKAYEAVEMLKSLGLPVSSEQLRVIAEMEKDYLRDEVIPLFMQELRPLVENVRNSFHMDVTYSKDEGLDIKLSEPAKQNRLTSPTAEDSGYRKKKFIIRITFPDKHVSCHRIVTNTFIDAIKYAGVENVKGLGIMLLGENLVSSKLHENLKYQAYQHEIEPGLYLCTYCNTDRKLEILKTINRELKLNLIIEKVMMD